MYVFMCVYRYPWNPQEGLEVHVVEVAGSCALPIVGAGHPGFLEGEALLTTAPRMFFLRLYLKLITKVFLRN